jgi:uncharacterized membrane protein YfhO
MLSSDTTMDSLQVSVSKGQHTISNIKVYTLDIATIYQQQVTPLQYQESSNNEILKGTLTTDNDGYFITSLPYQNGYRAYVDGKEIPIDIVNTSFVGFPLTKGNHTIQITFNAPGKSFAFYISGGSLLIIIYIFYKERGIVYEK